MNGLGCLQNMVTSLGNFTKKKKVIVGFLTDVICIIRFILYLARWVKDSEWESCDLGISLEWKSIALPVMEHYTEATDGSSIEQKESALVWHYQEAHHDFGLWQAKELLDHLESVLANDPVVVKSGQQIVEVKPQVCGWKSLVGFIYMFSF